MRVDAGHRPRGRGRAARPRGSSRSPTTRRRAAGGAGARGSDEPGEALMFSLLLRPSAPTEALAPLALVVGIAVAEALPVAARAPLAERRRRRAARSWPGILTELETPAGRRPLRRSSGSASTSTRRRRAARRPIGCPPRRCSPRRASAHDRLALLHDVTGPHPGRLPGVGGARLRGRCSTGSARSTTWPAGRSCSSSATASLTGVAAGVDGAGRLVVLLADGSERRLDAGEVVRVDDDPAGR